MLAEDNEINREIARKLVGESGVVIEEACDGAEAVRMVRESEEGYYDLILMDIQMPEMDGYEATREIRALERQDVKRLSIVAMTANAFAEDVKAACRAGMNAHLAKPIDLNELERILKQYLSEGKLVMLLIIEMLYPCINIQAKEPESGLVLRVAFPEVDGFTEIDREGNRHGVVVDYLNEIAKNTGWKYEYIPTDSESMTDRFLAGEFDLMGGTYYRKEFEKFFAYPDYNSGYTKSVLLARWDDMSIKAYDLKSIEGKTIGVYERAGENIRHLKVYLESRIPILTLPKNATRPIFRTAALQALS